MLLIALIILIRVNKSVEKLSTVEFINVNKIVIKKHVMTVKELHNYNKTVLVVNIVSKCLLEIPILELHVQIRFQHVECLVKNYFHVVINAKEAVIKENAIYVK